MDTPPIIPWSAAGCRRAAESLGLRPSKRLGQNFLPDRGLLERVVGEFAEIAPDEPVLEVGPGLGHLTSILLAAGARVTAIELDHRLAAHLRQVFARELDEGALTLAEEDVLGGKHELGPAATAWVDARSADAPGKLVANLPYAVASPLLVLLLERAARPGGASALASLVVCLQAEVADRLAAAAASADYGPLSVQIQYRGDVETVAEIGPGRFWPRPKVGSAIARIVPRAPARAASDEAAFAAFVRAAFNHRRKTLIAGLRKTGERDERGARADAAAAALASLDLPADTRAETLSVEQLVALAEAVSVALAAGGPDRRLGGA